MQNAITHNEQRPLLLTSAASIALLAIVNSKTTASIWMSLLLRPLMHGVSLFKIDLLLSFIVLAGLIASFGPIISSPSTLKRLWRIALGSLVLGCVLGAVMSLSLMLRLHLPLGNYAYFFSDGYNSVNQFAHLHITKAGLHFALSKIGLDQIAVHADTGRPFAEYVNPSIAVMILLSAVVSLIALLAASGAVVRSWNGFRRPVALILFSLAASHAVKCIVDGGVLAYDLLPSIVAVGFLVHHSRGIDLWSLLERYWMRIIAMTAAALTISCLFSYDVALVTQPQQYAYMFALYLLLAAPLLCGVGRNRALSFLAAPCLIWCVSYGYQHTIPDMIALSRTVSEKDRVFVCSTSEIGGDLRHIDVRDVSSDVTGQAVMDVYRSEAQNPLRNRSVIIRSSDDPRYTGFIFGLRVLRSDSLLTFDADKHLAIRGMTSVGSSSDSLLMLRVDLDSDVFPTLWNEESTVVDENNRFAVLYYLDDYFTSRGLKDYVLIPMYYEEET